MHVPYPQVADKPDFPALEREVLAYWAQDGTFEASVKARPGGTNEYVFYDGPPFANGLPHYGHLLTGFVKDAVPRYQTMRGRRVERRFGWDCHGLPPEMEAVKELDLPGRADIERYGVARFNDYCRTSVLRYTGEWERYVTRQARWVDFANDYKTMDLSYMESVMWAFSELHKKGLLYEGYRVLPYCWECETPLSNFETRQDNAYRPRQDPAVTVAFELVPPTTPGAPAGRIFEAGRPVRAIAWTTTPWTLPSNLALAVGREIAYAVLEAKDARYVLAEARLDALEEPLEAVLAGARRVGTLTGSDLVGLGYKPLFGFFEDEPGAFEVLGADFVSTEEGTGHSPRGPGFRRGRPTRLRGGRYPGGLPRSTRRGRFTAEVPPYQGMQVFDANRAVVADLRQNGALLRHGQLRAFLPALLADGHAPHLQGCQLLVRRGDGHKGQQMRRAQPGDQLGPGARPRRGFRQMVGRGTGLVDNPQPVLGLARAGVEERRPEVPPHRRVWQPRRAGGATSVCGPPTCTARRWTSWCAPTPTTRRGAR